MLCKLCGDLYEGASNTKFCRTLKMSSCDECGEKFSWICQKRTPKGCSQKCSSILANRSLIDKNCFGCGDKFNAGYQQKYCFKKVESECKKCSRIFTRECRSRGSFDVDGPENEHFYNGSDNREDLSKKLTQFCDSICWNLSSSFPVSKIEEYRSINEWAENFKILRKRLPSVKDVRSEFKVRNLPKHADLTKFVKTSQKSSYLEDLVEEALKDILSEFSAKVIPNGASILKNMRPLINDNAYKNNHEFNQVYGRRLEVDFLIPELDWGIEVQDFDTHSRFATEELNRFGDLKKGPEYFYLKKKLAKEQVNIELYEIWEDEIISDNLKNTLMSMLPFN